MRINGGVNLDEFEAAITSVLAGAKPFKETLQHASTGKATDEEWQLLAYFSWDQAADLGMRPDEVLTARQLLADKVPSHLKKERSNFAAALLDAAARNPGSAMAAKVKDKAHRYLDAMFQDKETVKAARNVIIYSSNQIVPWLQPNMNSAGYKKLKDRWLDAAVQLASDNSLSVDNRLWAINPVLALHKHEVGEAVAEDVKEADRTGSCPPCRPTR